jgi:hypothetical protein
LDAALAPDLDGSNQRDSEAFADQSGEVLDAKKRWRWKQFGLRTMLVLLLISGLFANWLNLGYRQHLAVKSIRDLGGTVWYEGQVDSRGQVFQDKRVGNSKVSNTKSGNDPKSDYFHSVVKVSLNGHFHTPWGSPQTTVRPLAMMETDAWKAIRSLSKLKFLELAATDIDDTRRLAGMRQLECLDLRHTGISDVSHLVAMKGLRELELAGTKVADLTPLANLRELEVLDLEKTPISTIEPLAGCAALKFLNIERTSIADISALKKTTKLEKLFLKFTKVTDLSPLASHPSLSMLVIARTKVANLDSILDSPNLTWLQLNQSKVSKAQLQKFKEANPNCYTSR